MGPDDLGNFALTALPIAHDVLRPHIAPHLLAPPTAASLTRDTKKPWPG